MMKMSKGQAPDYSIRDSAKLKAVAKRLGISVNGRKDMEIAGDVALLPSPTSPRRRRSSVGGHRGDREAVKALSASGSSRRG